MLVQWEKDGKTPTGIDVIAVATGTDPANPNAVLWNPQTAPFEEAWMKLGAPDGTLAVVGYAGNTAPDHTDHLYALGAHIERWRMLRR